MLFYCFFLLLIFGLMLFDKLIVDTRMYNVKLIGNEVITSREYPKMNSSGLLKGAFGLLFCISAFRFNVGWDYLAYYNTIKYHLVTNIVSSGEYATIFLIELSRLTGMVNLFFVVNSFICIYFIYKTTTTYSLDPWLSLLFFICFPLFFLNSLSVIRFFTALAIGFYAFKYIEQKKPIKYVLLILLASLFHKSALIAGVFYVARYIKLGSIKLLAIFVSLPILAEFMNKFVVKYLPEYAIYTETTKIQEGTKAIIFLVVIALLGLFLRKRIIFNDEAATIYLNIYFLGIAIYLMFYNQGTMGHRLSLFGIIYGLLLVPKMFSLAKGKIERAFLKLVFFSLLVIMFLYTINGGAATYIPYQSIFE